MQDKLLLMGVDSATRDAITYAKQKGVYTILTDCRPLDSCPERRMADEQWTIDVVDLDALEAKCRSEQVTGVFAGNHELCLDMTKALCERLGLPFYATDEGWACTRDKLRFKQHCIDCGIAVPRRYELTPPFSREALDAVEYPVIVKPTDACAQRGLSLCHNEQELLEAYERALQFSASHTVLVEEWIDGTEISFDYLFLDGKPVRIALHHSVSIEVNQRRNFTLFLEPSVHCEPFDRQVGDKMEALFRSMNWTKGLVFIQAICRDGIYYFLEMGGRLDGSGTWAVEKETMGESRLEYMVDLALGHPIRPTCDPVFNHYGKYSAFYLFWARPGRIVRIEGEDAVRAMPGVNMILKRFHEGDEICETDNMLQMAYYLAVVADSREQLVQKICDINRTLNLYDAAGNNLLLPFTEFEKLDEVYG